MSKIEHEELTEEALVKNVEIVPILENLKRVPIEIDTGRNLNVNPNIDPDQMEIYNTLLKQHKGALAWEYMDMKGIPSELCTHHTYIKNECRPICKP